MMVLQLIRISVDVREEYLKGETMYNIILFNTSEVQYMIPDRGLFLTDNQ